MTNAYPAEVKVSTIQRAGASEYNMIGQQKFTVESKNYILAEFWSTFLLVLHHEDTKQGIKAVLIIEVREDELNREG